MADRTKRFWHADFAETVMKLSAYSAVHHGYLTPFDLCCVAQSAVEIWASETHMGSSYLAFPVRDFPSYHEPVVIPREVMTRTCQTCWEPPPRKLSTR